VVGRLAGPVPTLIRQRCCSTLKIGGVAIATYTNAEAGGVGEHLQALAWTNAKPLIDKVFPFAEVPRLSRGCRTDRWKGRRSDLTFASAPSLTDISPVHEFGTGFTVA